MSDKAKCTLTNDELIAKATEWVYSLAKSGGDSWTLSVPVNFNKDPDILFMELCSRLAAKATSPLTTEQTELWKEFLDEASRQLYAIDAETSSEETAIAQLAEKYSITRKQEVPEAVEFAEWIAQKHYYKDVHKEWYGCERGMTVLIAKTTAELFQLFKNRS